MSWREATTESLVREAQQGDREAVDELFERYRPRLLRMIRCRLDPRLKTRVDESDVAQDALALASRDLPSYRPQAHVPFYAWLRQIAWRQLLRASERHLETGKRSVLKEQSLNWNHSRSALTEQLLNKSTPSKVMMRTELSEQVGVALDSLSETDREVLALRFLERLPTKEAAAIQGISEAASRQRLTRALQRLGEQVHGLLSSCSKGEDDECHRNN